MYTALIVIISLFHISSIFHSFSLYLFLAIHESISCSVSWVELLSFACLTTIFLVRHIQCREELSKHPVEFYSAHLFPQGTVKCFS